jgi:hypothetical protein
MSQLDQAWARCTRGVVAVAIWFLAVEAMDPTAPRVLLDRGIRATLALGLAFGILPGSYLNRLVHPWRRRETRASATAFRVLSLGIPLLMLATALALIVGAWQTLSSLPPEADNAPTWWSLAHSAGMGVVAIVLLVFWAQGRPADEST